MHVYIFIRPYFIMAFVGRNLLAVLIAITMIVSLVGTIAAIAVISGYGGYSTVPVSLGNQGGGSGKVAVYLTPEPAPVTGKVAVYLDSSEDGG
jgi:hypothetical protein